MPMSTLRPHVVLLAAAAVAIVLALRPASASGAPPGDAPPPAELLPGTLAPLLLAELAARAGDDVDTDRAVHSYMDAARAHRSSAFARRAARIAARAARFPLAVDASGLWHELDPDDPAAHRMLALMLSRAGRPAEAAAALRRIARPGDASDPGGLETVVRLLRQEPDVDRRIGIMESVADADPESRYALARVLAGSGRLERAVGILEVLTREAPREDRFSVTHAMLLHDRGDRDAALEVLAHREAEDGGSDALLRTYARLLDSAGRHEEASDRYATLVERRPHDHVARWELGRLLTRMERLDDARPHFEMLYRAGEWRDGAWYFTGLIDQTQEAFDRALRAYRRVRGGVYYVSARIRTAEIMTDSGQLEWARRHLAATPRYARGDDVRLYRAESGLLVRAELPAEAMGVLDRGLAAYPDDDDLLYSRAMVAERLDRLDVLERDLRSIIARDPEHIDALNALGYTLADRTDRFEEALDLVERALALDPNRSYIVDSMGWVLFRLGRHEEAADWLRRSHEMEADPVVAAHLGEALWVLGRHDEAREIWESALEDDPENEVLLETIERFGS